MDTINVPESSYSVANLDPEDLSEFEEVCRAIFRTLEEEREG